jgi:hypothetical protein
MRRDKPVRLHAHGDTFADADVGRRSFDRDLAKTRRDLDEEDDDTTSARGAFDQDIARSRAALDEEEHPGETRMGARGYPIDIDDPMAVWDYESRNERARKDASELAWMHANNPYEGAPDIDDTPLDIDDPAQVAGYEQATARRPHLAALFPVRKPAPSKAGPIDWMAAMHERNRAYRPSRLDEALVREMEAPEPEPMPKRRGPENTGREEVAYRDADLRHGKSALGRTMKRKPKKKAA